MFVNSTIMKVEWKTLRYCVQCKKWTWQTTINTINTECEICEQVNDYSYVRVGERPRIKRKKSEKVEY